MQVLGPGKPGRNEEDSSQSHSRARTRATRPFPEEEEVFRGGVSPTKMFPAEGRAGRLFWVRALSLIFYNSVLGLPNRAARVFHPPEEEGVSRGGVRPTKMFPITSGNVEPRTSSIPLSHSLYPGI